jgi:hypothetical protein
MILGIESHTGSWAVSHNLWSICQEVEWISQNFLGMKLMPDLLCAITWLHA